MNVSQMDFMRFQEEVFSTIRRLEESIRQDNSKLSESLEERLTPFKSKFDDIDNRIIKLANSIGKDNAIYENLDQLLKFKIKVEDKLQCHEVDIEKVSSEITNNCYRLDKVLMENLYVPGLIGNTSKYKNLRTFLESAESKLSDLLMFKEIQTNEFKRLKDKFENVNGQFSIQIEKSQKSFVDYCKTCMDALEEKFTSQNKFTNDYIENLRFENGKYAAELKESSKSLKVDQEFFINIKDEMFKKFDDELNKFKESLNNECETMKEYKNEFKLIKQRFTELSEFIKDVRFRRNVGKELKVKDFRDMSRKINFDKKQKLDADYNEEDYDSPTCSINSPSLVKKHIDETPKTYYRQISTVNKKNNEGDDKKNKFSIINLKRADEDQTPVSVKNRFKHNKLNTFTGLSHLSSNNVNNNNVSTSSNASPVLTIRGKQKISRISEENIKLDLSNVNDNSESNSNEDEHKDADNNKDNENDNDNEKIVNEINDNEKKEVQESDCNSSNTNNIFCNKSPKNNKDEIEKVVIIEKIDNELIKNELINENNQDNIESNIEKKDTLNKINNEEVSEDKISNINNDNDIHYMENDQNVNQAEPIITKKKKIRLVDEVLNYSNNSYLNNNNASSNHENNVCYTENRATKISPKNRTLIDASNCNRKVRKVNTITINYPEETNSTNTNLKYSYNKTPIHLSKLENKTQYNYNKNSPCNKENSIKSNMNNNNNNFQNIEICKLINFCKSSLKENSPIIQSILNKIAQADNHLNILEKTMINKLNSFTQQIDSLNYQIKNNKNNDKNLRISCVTNIENFNQFRNSEFCPLKERIDNNNFKDRKSITFYNDQSNRRVFKSVNKVINTKVNVKEINSNKNISTFLNSNISNISSGTDETKLKPHFAPVSILLKNEQKKNKTVLNSKDYSLNKIEPYLTEQFKNVKGS